ncbi:MAG TPA: S41 family peptidase, partial [Rectinemataceae bacterium]|nr:S41 family peptidase [Rectinemataceae bacterium]
MTAEQRAEDIKFLAKWAKDYSPFVELNEKLRGLPNYEAVAPRYAQMAAEAKTDAEFFQVVYGYFSLLGRSGHGHLLSEGSLRGFLYEARSEPGQLPPDQLKAGLYWPRIEESCCYVHPPFRIDHDGGEDRMHEDWRCRGGSIPKGSKIVRVNGKPCSAYLEWLRKETWIRHILRDTDWITETLLVVREGGEFRGWQVDFQLPDGTTRGAFVPCSSGLPGPTDFSDYESSDGNCVCLELAEDVGYLRVKCMGKMFIEKDGKQIREFLERSGGKYHKLIIDVRQNGGGLHYYAFDNLIAPFLDKSVAYSEIGGIRRPFLNDHEPAFLERLRRGVSIFAHERDIKEIEPPVGWDPARWIFYQIERRVDPRDRYKFSGRLFILIDGGTGSAADEYVNMAQRIGLATL